MAEVRLLHGQEIQGAVSVAREAYMEAMPLYIRSKEEAEQFYREVTPAILWQQISAGNLFLWGVFTDAGLCAVGAIQKDGRITMLYVRSDCQRRGMGLLLLDSMRDYAASSLGLSKVTVTVSPVTLAAYFHKRGFTAVSKGAESPGRVSLECPLRQESADPYPKRPVSVKLILVLTAAVLALSFGVIGGITLHHLMKEEMFDKWDYREIMRENDW